MRAQSFGSAAETYERYRMGYPDELVNAVLRYAGRPVDSALEVGAGTGKATAVFAGRGIEVTALEPDLEMARVLARTTRGLPVQVVVSTFEAFPADRGFDLLYAAAAWHWTDPATRWSRAAELLVPGASWPCSAAGTAAAIGSWPNGSRRSNGRHCPTPTGRSAARGRSRTPEGRRPGRRRGARPAADGDDDGRRLRQPARDRVGLPHPREAERADLLGQVRAALPDRFEIDTMVRVSLARRVG